MNNEFPFLSALVNLFSIQESYLFSSFLFETDNVQVKILSQAIRLIEGDPPSQAIPPCLRTVKNGMLLPGTYHDLKPISSVMPQIHPSVWLPSRIMNSEPLPWITELKVEHFTVLLVLIYCSALTFFNTVRPVMVAV